MIKLLRTSQLFKTLMFTFLILLFLTIIIILSISFTFLYTKQLRELEQNMHESTALASRFIKDTLASVISSASYIAGEITQMSEDEIYELFKHSVNTSNLYQHIMYMDRNGIVKESYNKYSSENILDNNYSHHTYFKAIAEGNQIYYISDYIRSYTNLQEVSISVGIHDVHEDLIGVLVIGINLKELNDLGQINHISAHSQSYLYIVDRLGNIILHEDTTMVGDVLPQNDQFHAFGFPHNSHTTFQFQKSFHRLVYYTPNQFSEWTVIGVLPTNHLWKRIIGYMVTLTLILFLLMFALLLVTMWLFADILRPILYLTEELQNMNIEDAKVVDDTVHQDLQPLFKTYNKMITSFQIHNKWMTDQIYIDPLTQLYNRRYLDTYRNTLERSMKDGTPFVIYFFDIDHFKLYNDTLGHPEGDYLLTTLGQQLLLFFRERDKVFRVGGEEFIVILENCTRQTGYCRSEELVRTIREYPFRGREVMPLGRITISLGLASYPSDGDDLAQLIYLADKACYAAKQSGRNQVALSEPEVSSLPVVLGDSLDSS